MLTKYDTSISSFIRCLNILEMYILEMGQTNKPLSLLDEVLCVCYIYKDYVKD